jgi:hypothetical protein
MLPRDLAILSLLDKTPATTAQLVRASVTFGCEPFGNERRARERMQALGREKLVRPFSLGIAGGGLANYYRLTAEGFRLLHSAETALPHRSWFAELPPSRLMHTLELADVIVHALVAAHTFRTRVTKFHRENELVLETGAHRVSPDCHLQFFTAGRLFNVLVELDRSTESLDSSAATSIRSKLLAYEAYQDFVWTDWKQHGERGPRPYFRVAFLTASQERAHHILAVARECAHNKDRRLCYAATLDSFLAESDALRAPLFLDHHGHWQALANVHPTARFLRTPVRIAPLVQSSLFV